MQNELIERLLDDERLADLGNCNRHLTASDMREAAAVIKAQTAEIAELGGALERALECLAGDETFTPESVIALGCEALANVRGPTLDPRYCGCDHVPCEHHPACNTPRCHNPAYCDGLCNECFHEWLHNGGTAGKGRPEMSEGLKPCRRCGVSRTRISNRYTDHYQVHCMHCGADGPSGARIEIAIAAWNTRSAPAQPNKEQAR
jgi:hypothetical protein